METLFDIAGISRQAFYQGLLPSAHALSVTPASALVERIQYIRQKHLPGQGARKIRQFMLERLEHAPLLQGWGKHRFEALCMTNGLRILPRRNFLKTTQPGHVIFPNLIQGMQINNINQVWVSDISYVFYRKTLLGYLTTVQDIYSRLLLALIVSRTMRAVDTVIPALHLALQFRQMDQLPGLIFHSDQGAQYGAKKFLDLLRSCHIQSSMAANALENSYAERLNGTLKNGFLYRWPVNSFGQLEVFARKTQRSYNFLKPHDSLQGMAPWAFEQFVATLQPDQRTCLTVKLIE